MDTYRLNNFRIMTGWFGLMDVSTEIKRHGKIDRYIDRHREVFTDFLIQMECS